jgi:alkaline phosphatase
MKNIVLAALAIILNSFSMFAQDVTGNNKPENIIIIIEEGIGIPVMTAAQFIKGMDLNLSKAATVGFIKTSSANDVVTDPAAMATAIACGIKTDNGMIGMNNKLEPVPNIFDLAKKKKMWTGLVTTSFLVDPVPAAFYSHQPSVKSYGSIAKDLVGSDMSVFIGGGKKYFRTMGDSSRLINELTTRGYKILEDYKDLKTRSHKNIAGLISSDALPGVDNGRGDYLNLAWLRAFKTLIRNDTGYMLVIHNAHINWAAANNEKKEMIDEILDMDSLLGQVLRYTAAGNKTLVIVIGGFETGGITVMGNKYSKTDPNMKFTTKQRTAAMAPVFAFGPGADVFSGFYDNTDIYLKLKLLIE